jgi:3-hydroxyanthranilate 3,4-dioxygenase
MIDPRPALPPAIDLHAWIDQHRDLLKPPVGNKCIVDGDFIVMIVGGPNRRSDFHYDEGPEFFYQLEGEMSLRVQENAGVRDIPIRAGEIFYLPPGIWHSPQRAAGSVGLVVERKRLAHERDGLAWFCASCNNLLYEEFFVLKDIEVDLPEVFDHFFASPTRRTCSRCGTVHPLPESRR